MTNEADLHRKWFPEDAEKARAHRTAYDERTGRHGNCRHFGKQDQTGGTFHCEKKKKHLKNCTECRVCTNCNGSLAFYRHQINRVRSGTHITEEYTCICCGAYFVRYFFEARRQEKKTDHCQVDGCRYHRYQGALIQEGGKEWALCISHFRKMETWKADPEKGEDRRPFIVQGEYLVDNPDYRKRQERERVKLPDQEMADKYLLQGMSTQALGEEYGVDANLVRERLKELGVWSLSHTNSICGKRLRQKCKPAS